MIKTNQPKFIIHLGMGPNGLCYNKKFLEELILLDYNYQIISTKMLSQMYDFKYDKIRSNILFYSFYKRKY